MRTGYYLKIWQKWGANALQEAFVNRGTNALFFLGKTLRVAMSLVVLLLIKQNINTFAGYTADQMVVFFLVYQLIDSISQAVFRGVYSFGRLVRNGEFDFDLLKPISPLFRSLMGSPDINDVIFLGPLLLATGYILSTLNLDLTVASSLGFLALLLNSLLIAAALHIIVLSIAIFTTEVDGVIWMYRDLSRLGQFPITAYLELMKLALFFLVPIGMMITIPAEVLLNLTPSYSIWLTIAISGSFITFSLWLWKLALRNYTSASS